MKHHLLRALVAIAAIVLVAESASAGWPVWNQQSWAAWRGRSLPWHNAYYHAAYGEPIALVVPPTAEYQSHYGWGVGATRVTPIYHQFGRAYPGATGASGYFYPTPAWPSDTNQFGVYYIRGPW